MQGTEVDTTGSRAQRAPRKDVFKKNKVNLTDYLMYWHTRIYISVNFQNEFYKGGRVIEN